MTGLIPHPTDATFADAYSDAWTNDPEFLLKFFTPDGSYTDVALRGRYEGHGGILKFHRFMLKFSPDSAIRFYDAAAKDGLIYMEWTWSGSVTGPLRLPTGDCLDAAGKKFSATGIAACAYVDDGKLSSHRDFWDLGLLVDQLGQRRPRRRESSSSHSAGVSRRIWSPPKSTRSSNR